MFSVGSTQDWESDILKRANKSGKMLLPAVLSTTNGQG